MYLNTCFIKCIILYKNTFICCILINIIYAFIKIILVIK